MDVKEGISFGPALIVNGERMITSGDGGWGVGPRTAIGQRKTVLFYSSSLTGVSRLTPSEPRCEMYKIFCMKKAPILRLTWTAVRVLPYI